MNRRVFYTFLAIFSFSLLSSIKAFAVEISDEQASLIKQNCSSIKIQLQKVQHNDVKNRVYLGNQYEAISSNLMTNLNARFLKNNLDNTTFSNQQTLFLSERTRFKNDYIGYSQELETLIGMDCTSDAQGFYDQLEKVREKRGSLAQSIWRMRQNINKHRASVQEYLNDLKEVKDE